MKKVGVFTRPIEQGTSGSGSHLEKLLEEIYNLHEIKNEFEIVLLHHKESSKEIYKKFKSEIVSRNPIIAYFQILKFKFDILHYSPLTILYPVFFLRSIKKVATIHGGAIFFYPSQYSFIKRLHEKYIRPVYARQMDIIFTVSNHSKELIKKKDKVSDHKIVTIYNGVNEEFKKNSDKKTKQILAQKFGIESRYLFHISKFSERKNPWTILQSFNEIAKTKSDIQLLIGGSGWNNTEVKQFIEEHSLMGRVVLTGFVNKNELIGLYSFAEVFIFPSLYEGFGMPNLEAMACGCPVVTTNVYAIPEVVGSAALKLEDVNDYKTLAKMIIEILDHSDLRKNLIESGYKRVNTFKWETSAKKLLETYNGLL